MELYSVNKKGRWEQIASNLNDNFGKVNTAIEQALNKTTPNRGYYSNVEVLKAEVSDAKVGDIAYVGLQAPFSVYEYTSDGWLATGGTHTPTTTVNLDNYYPKSDSDQRFLGYQREAEEINKVAPTLVNEALRKTAQTLTDAEKIQSRANIGAASKDELTSLSATVQTNKNDTDNRITQLESRVKNVTLEEWEELEKNKTWIEGVEYNVYEV